jgi:hypothetical protein
MSDDCCEGALFIPTLVQLGLRECPMHLLDARVIGMDVSSVRMTWNYLPGSSSAPCDVEIGFCGLGKASLVLLFRGASRITMPGRGWLLSELSIRIIDASSLMPNEFGSVRVIGSMCFWASEVHELKVHSD